MGAESTLSGQDGHVTSMPAALLPSFADEDNRQVSTELEDLEVHCVQAETELRDHVATVALLEQHIIKVQRGLQSKHAALAATKADAVTNENLNQLDIRQAVRPWLQL